MATNMESLLSMVFVVAPYDDDENSAFSLLIEQQAVKEKKKDTSDQVTLLRIEHCISETVQQ